MNCIYVSERIEDVGGTHCKYFVLDVEIVLENQVVPLSYDLQLKPTDTP